MSLAEREIINRNIIALIKAPNQCFTEVDFLNLDIKIFPSPKELISKMEKLDLIELDLDDDKYYLTEHGYDYHEKLTSKKRNYYYENVPISLTHYYHKNPKRLKVIVFMLIPTLLIVCAIKIISPKKNKGLNLPTGTHQHIQHQLDSLLKVHDTLPKQ
ncbi:MAG: hypothetical protein N4A35_14870 [Flavobacteriales bacterium]|jgi:hypothetical protein|nr:hypothetical protein [Flavobacteriales bacterium]